MNKVKKRVTLILDPVVSMCNVVVPRTVDNNNITASSHQHVLRYRQFEVIGKVLEPSERLLEEMTDRQRDRKEKATGLIRLS